LAPIVGLGPGDVGSLVSAVSRSPEANPPPVNLTIDLHMQQVARDVLLRAHESCNSPKPAQSAGPRLPCIRQSQQAVIVLMDADDRPGEIRAIASWPAANSGFHMWDILALDSRGSSASPAAGLAWRATDQHYQPGSTFKSVTALAAIESVLDPQKNYSPMLGQILRGQLSEDAGANFLVLRKKVAEEDVTKPCRFSARESGRESNILPVPRHDGVRYDCLKNFEEDYTYDDFTQSPDESDCPPALPVPPRQEAPDQLGLCEALIQSMNIYFAGVALILDRHSVLVDGAVPEKERDDAAPNSAIGVEAGRLFPTVDLTRGTHPGAFKLLANGLEVDATLPNPKNAPHDRRVMVAQSGYGQSVRATPLAMTTVYASIAKGQIVRPRLVPIARTEDPEEGTPLIQHGTAESQAEYFNILKAGLHGVVAAVGVNATAVSAFKSSPPLIGPKSAPRLFGKTGTATISSQYLSLWFAGWIEANPNRGIDKRLAFGCFVSHERNDDVSRTGGGTCAPLIREVLDLLDRRAP